VSAHELKIWPDYFEDVLTGTKTFELRDGRDRDFKVGDVLFLQEWRPSVREYTGRSTSVVVTYILRDVGGLEPGFVVLGIKAVL
jgi:uncharacterized protein YqfB (UPF0267 family)